MDGDVNVVVDGDVVVVVVVDGDVVVDVNVVVDGDATGSHTTRKTQACGRDLLLPCRSGPPYSLTWL